jgi:hypothetical protein
MTTIGTTSRPAYVYDADTDTWVPIGVGPHTHDEYIDKTIIDAKGSIVVGTGLDTAGILAVGTDGQYLVADSEAATGIAWVDVDALPDQTGEAGNYLTTNGTDASWATVDALPSQSGQNGNYLTTNGTTASWSTITTDPTPQVFLMMGA